MKDSLDKLYLNYIDLFDTHSNCAYFRDCDGIFKWCNLSFLKKLNLQNKNELYQISLEDISTNKFLKCVTEKDETVIKNRTNIDTFLEIGHLIKIPVFSETGEILGIFCLLDQSKIALEKLEEEKEMLDQIIANVPGNLYWKDKNCVLLGCNNEQAAYAHLKDRKDIVGKTDYDILSADQDDNSRKIQADIINNIDKQIMLSGNKNKSEETVIIPGEKNAKTFLSYKTPLKDKNNTIIGLVGISVDITEQKRLEKELMDAKEIAEEARDVAEKSKQKAEISEKLKTQFIQDMQHDIRTPASGVWAVLEQLMKEEKDPKKKKILSMIEAAQSKLLRICNKIIAFEQAEKSIEPIVFSANNIREFVYGLVALNEPAAYHKLIDLKLYVEPDVPTILLIDEYRLERILINLIGNALKFTPEGGSVFITVRTSKNKHNKMVFQFEVKDTGIGFSEEDKELIFEKFVRLNPSNAGIYEGSGLGLSIVKKFVSELGGDVTVTSQKGEGSAFVISLPFEIVKDTVSQTKSDTVEKPAIVETPQNIHLLFIEDDMIARHIGLSNLESLGYTVDVAEDVASAKDHLLRKQYQFVLSDIGLPDGKGTDIVAWVKSHPLHLNQQTPFVALTAHSSPEVQEQALESGFIAVLNKPFPIEEVHQYVQQYAKIPEPIVLDATPVSSSKPVSNATSEMQAVPHDVIDLGKTLKTSCGGNVEMLKKILKILADDLPNSLLELEKLCEQNDIALTRKLLHRLDGGFRYCIVPRLQQTREALHEAVKQTDTLSTLKPLYNNFFQEIDYYLRAYEKLKQDEKI